MRVTIKDIAKKAGVSPSTVSRVIANHPRISSATKHKVMKIMKELDYHPNMIARSLASKSSKIIGVIIPGTAERSFEHPFFPELLRGIGTVAYQHGYNILISSVTSLEEEKDTIIQFARGGITDGVILLTSRVRDPSVAELIKMSFPFVIIGRSEQESRVNWVDNDNFSIGYELTEHFIKRGHRRIAFLGLSPDFLVTVDRFNGYKQALRDHGIPVDEELVVESQFVTDDGYHLMKTFYRHRSVQPTGIIACDDLLAFGAIKYLNEHGLEVPRDVAVAGVNNVPQAAYFSPSLTSVEINAFSLGAKAVELLLAEVNEEYTAGVPHTRSYSRTIIPAELIVRDSTGR
ncbi:MAG TPA: LacI family transcriptional regulator [Firmicutes bacterium]|nr:LacI family transcriptional regulator [Bacillota bacterium]